MEKIFNYQYRKRNTIIILLILVMLIISTNILFPSVMRNLKMKLGFINYTESIYNENSTLLAYLPKPDSFGNNWRFASIQTFQFNDTLDPFVIDKVVKVFVGNYDELPFNLTYLILEYQNEGEITQEIKNRWKLKNDYLNSEDISSELVINKYNPIYEVHTYCFYIYEIGDEKKKYSGCELLTSKNNMLFDVEVMFTDIVDIDVLERITNEVSKAFIEQQ